MEKEHLDRTLAMLAILAMLIVMAMIVAIVTTGVGQDFFQSARPIDEFIGKVTANPNNALGLRINLGLDNLFIVVYATYFVVLAVRFRSTMDSQMITVALGAILLTALLDAIENQHITVMIHSVQHGLPITVAESQLQMVVSSVKFHSSYVALFLFALGFLREGAWGRAIAWVFWLYVVLGLIAMVTPIELARPLALGRTVFFVVSFLLSAMFFRRSASRRD